MGMSLETENIGLGKWDDTDTLQTADINRNMDIIDNEMSTTKDKIADMPIIQTGAITITPSAANTATSATVTFSTPFPGTPRISVTPQNSAAGTTLLGWAATGASATSFTCWLTRSNTVSAILQWIAVYIPE